MGSLEQFDQHYKKAPLRRPSFATMSGIELDPVYGPDGGEFPGQFPFTRGIHASMYRSKLWTMRQFAGFGSADDTNRRFRDLLSAGGTGLSVAFDMPTLLGKDSDDPFSLGEVGRAGVAIDSVDDMDVLLTGIDMEAVTTSMTINSPAAVILAMFVAVAHQRGCDLSRVGGTLQNDILKEYQAQKEYVFPPRPSVRLVSDVMAYCHKNMPRFHPISISGYHIREAGSTAAQELAFTLANGFSYVEAGLRAGLKIDDFAPRLSFFFNAHIDFFEEIAKYRAARRIYARWMRDHYGARSDRSQQLRFHTQTAGVSLAAQQPEVNLARVAIEALAGVLGGTQSLHTDAYDEALALPTDKAARLALRTQQVIAEETGVTSVADPLGGSYFLEALTDRLEQEAEVIFARLLELGDGSMLDGVISAIEDGSIQQQIADSAYELQHKMATGEFVMVGVNGYTDGDDSSPELLRIDPEVESAQLARLHELRARRDERKVTDALVQVEHSAADPSCNMMESLIAASLARATVGEQMAAMEKVFGTWMEPPVV